MLLCAIFCASFQVNESKSGTKKSIPSWWGEKSACSFAVNVLHECPFCTSHYTQSPYLHVYTISRTFLLSLCAPIFCCSLFLPARSARRDFPAKYKCSRTGFIIYSIVIFIALFTLSLSMRRLLIFSLSVARALTHSTSHLACMHGSHFCVARTPPRDLNKLFAEWILNKVSQAAF